LPVGFTQAAVRAADELSNIGMGSGDELSNNSMSFLGIRMLWLKDYVSKIGMASCEEINDISSSEQ